MSTPLAQSLLAWYAEHGRQLPWRRTEDPYALWVAEVMLQQTRVDSVVQYYARWMARFPTLSSLAAADRQEVLRFWEGLGYYRRAHQLHRAAQEVVARHGGQLPRTMDELLALPGIGRYTAGALAAIAFGADELALDGNLRRVLSRLFDLPLDPTSAQGERRLRAGALAHMPPGQASAFNQALMDLGATVCLPRRPRCERCPLAAHCLARQRGRQLERPVRKARKALPRHVSSAGVLRVGGQVLLSQRPAGSLLGGLWRFPGGRCREGEEPPECLRRIWREEMGIDVRVGQALAVIEHAYTHYQVRVHAYDCLLRQGRLKADKEANWRWVALGELHAYPMGKVDRLLAKSLTGADVAQGIR